MAFERVDRLATFPLPEPQRSVIRSRDGTAAILRHHYGDDPVRMAFERSDRLAFQVPEPQRPVNRSRDGTVAVGTYSARKNFPVENC
jgi:hypothetical protein